VVQQFERIAPAGQPVLDAAQDQRTAVLRLQRPNFIERQPVRRQDAVVELPPGSCALISPPKAKRR
jgi:hypothetical protein